MGYSEILIKYQQKANKMILKQSNILQKQIKQIFENTKIHNGAFITKTKENVPVYFLLYKTAKEIIFTYAESKLTYSDIFQHIERCLMVLSDFDEPDNINILDDFQFDQNPKAMSLEYKNTMNDILDFIDDLEENYELIKRMPPNNDYCAIKYNGITTEFFDLSKNSWLISVICDYFRKQSENSQDNSVLFNFYANILENK